ncbi:MAG TPA: autotransporter-associated beta strand repeat-containing protein [Candidatus Paceibacterota bacterium]|nr:autotransporter-associated beta strand repeat-containing protein [Verrucomicrobiota bacterium]HRZ44830.1 autotransporter-associated beta strand repeat-containing protein [Candidatus Paceibacterota bacterium]
MISSSNQQPLGCLAMLALSLVWLQSIQAATRTWTGDAGGNWSVSANWTPSGAPASGDSLTFPALGAGKTYAMTNNLAGRSFGALAFTGSGYTLRGNAFNLANGITASAPSGNNTIEADVTLGASQTFAVASAILTLNGGLGLNGRTLTLASDGSTRLGGVIGGTGHLRKTGAGSLTLQGASANTYSGHCTVVSGTLQLNKAGVTAVTGALTNNATVRYFDHSQIAGSVVLGPGSLLDLNDHNDDIGALSMTGATVDTGTGLLTLGGNITTFAHSAISTIQGKLSLGASTRTFAVEAGVASPDLEVPAAISGAGGIVKTGAGTLVFRGANTYSGATTVSQGRIYAYHDSAFGSASGGVEVQGSGNIYLVNANVGAEELILDVPASSGTAFYSSGVCNWAGPVTLSTDVQIRATGTNIFSGRISGPGGLKLSGDVHVFSGADGNTYTGETLVACDLLRMDKTSAAGVVAVPGTLRIGEGAAVSNAVHALRAYQIHSSSEVILQTNGVLSLGSHHTQMAKLDMTGGRVDSTTGNLIINRWATIRGSAMPSIIDGIIDLGSMAGTRLFDLIEGVHPARLVVRGEMKGAAGADFHGNGDCVVEMLASNSYSGLTVIDNCGLVARTAAALGNSTGGTLIQGGGTLSLNGLSMAGETLEIDSASDYALYGIGTCGWQGRITVNTNAMLYSSGTLILSGIIDGPGSVRLKGYTFEFGGADANTLSGEVLSECKLLRLNKSPANNAAIAGALSIGTGFKDHPSVVLEVTGNQLPSACDITIREYSLLDLNDQNDVVGALAFNGGRVDTGAGYIRPMGPITVHSNSAEGVIDGRLRLGVAQHPFTIHEGKELCGLRINATIENPGSTPAGIRKGGAGRLCLAASNSFTGQITIDDGSIHAAHNYALGAPAGGTIVNSGATLGFTGVPDNVFEPITLNGPGASDGGALRTSGALAIHSGLVLGSHSIILVHDGQLDLNGLVSGPGGFTKRGLGTLRLHGLGNNTYAGDTVAEQGEIVLAQAEGNAIPGAGLLIGEDLPDRPLVRVRYGTDSQISVAAIVTIQSSGLLDLGGFSDIVGDLVFRGGAVSNSSAGLLTLNGHVTVSSSSIARARIIGPVSLVGTRSFTVDATPNYPGLEVNGEVRGGGLAKLGAGAMLLSHSNSFTGIAQVRAGRLDVADAFALGATAGGTVVSNGAALILRDGTRVSGEPLTLAGAGHQTLGALASVSGSNSWSGPITLAGDTVLTATRETDFLDLSGAIDGIGNLTIEGLGTVRFGGAAANTYRGATRVGSGALELAKSVDDGSIPGDLVVGDNEGGTDADVVRYASARPQISDRARVTVNASGLLDLRPRTGLGIEDVGSIEGKGRIELALGGLGIGHDNTSTTFAGTIHGGSMGRLTKHGSGVFTLSGNNPYTGPTVVQGGTLLVNGSQPGSPVEVRSGAVLGGRGAVGGVGSAGILAPGASPGRLASSNVVLMAGSEFRAELDGAVAGSSYDQLSVRGTVDLGNASLHLLTSLSLPAGTSLILVDNDGADAVLGAFSELAEGALIDAVSQKYFITYQGGDGNDVALIATNPSPLEVVTVLFAGGNGVSMLDPNECNALRVVVLNSSDQAAAGLAAQLVSSAPGVAITAPFAAFPDLAPGERGTNLVPFQITTWPWFVCGSPAEFSLSLTSATHGAFSMPLTLSSGHPGPGAPFTSSGSFAIPDGGGCTNTITVPAGAITAPLARVAVGLHLTHEFVSDIDLYLVAPDGTRVELSTDNGAAGRNYGNDCGAMTVFVENGPPINSRPAPFVGEFCPEGSLWDLRSKPAQGDWSLIVLDDEANGISGVLQCWTLTLYPSVCGDGGGPCQSCPDRVIFGAITAGSPVQNERLRLDLTPGICGVSKPCPQPAVPGPSRFEAYTFVNGDADACVTVTLTASNGLFSAAYAGGFDPSNPCANYLADAGEASSAGVPRSYSFSVDAWAAFAVVVSETVEADFSPYRLEVRGGNCRPMLSIDQVRTNAVRLTWTTAAFDYELVQTNALPDPPQPFWPPSISNLRVSDSRFSVTNSFGPMTPSRFYKLRKR